MMHFNFVSSLKMLTFDVTGTLIKFRIPPPIQYVNVGKMHGVNVNAYEMSTNFKLCWKQMNQEHPNFGKESGLGWERWWYELVCRTFRAASKQRIEPSTLDTIACNLIHGYSSGIYYEIYPDVKLFLRNLKKRDYILGIISNNDDRLSGVLRNLDLLEYFDFVLTSYSTGFQKPSCEIFQKALDLNHITPTQAFHIGNSPELDFLGATRSGWNAALVHLDDKENIKQKYPSIPHYLMFDDFHDLNNMLS